MSNAKHSIYNEVEHERQYRKWSTEEHNVLLQHISQLEEMLEIYSVKRLTCAHGLIIALKRELEELVEETA